MIEPATSNPFAAFDEDGPLCQLKLSLVLYLDYAPGPYRARRVFDLYMDRFGRHIRVFKSTGSQGPLQEWNSAAAQRFCSENLPRLQRFNDWGYGFSDGRSIDGHLFMFHGYRPASEPGKASFFRFEWPWDWHADEVADFTLEVASSVPFLSGNAGYIFSARPLNTHAFDRMFAVCSRYWGVEAWNLDLTVAFARRGYKCPTWLTLIGDRLRERMGTRAEPDLAALADAARTRHGRVYRCRKRPDLLDQNRQASCAPEHAVAVALRELQLAEHDDFGGPRWEGRTLPWLWRFAIDRGAEDAFNRPDPT